MGIKADYKYGEYDAKIQALKEDVAELKISNKEQHEKITLSIEALTCEIGKLRDNINFINGKASVLGAITGFVAGFIIPVINFFKGQ